MEQFIAWLKYWFTEILALIEEGKELLAQLETTTKA